MTIDGASVTGLDERAVDAARWGFADADVSGVETAEDLERRIEPALGAASDQADGRPLAVRLRLVGARPKMALADRAALRETAQALAARFSEQILVEKVVSAFDEPRGTAADAPCRTSTPRSRPWNAIPPIARASPPISI